MADQLPTYLSQGETSRLFPVLSTTSKEGRTTSIVLATLIRVEEFGAALLATVGQKVGKKADLASLQKLFSRTKRAMEKIDLTD